jgi:glucans biosynthesis protein C
MPLTNRIDYMDNLRALAMLAGVLFHAALAYSPLLQPYFPTADRQHSVVVDVIAWFFHLFRMPLFFVVAGFCAALLVTKHGLAGMLVNRLRRIALPFVVFWPLVFTALLFLTLHAAENVQHPSPVLALIKRLSQQSDAPASPPTTGHLWFLYYLLLFYVLVWSASNLNLKKLADSVRSLSPALQLGLLPLLLVPSLASVTAPHPAPESFLPQFWSFGFFGLYFAYGYLLFNSEAIIDRQKSFAPWLLLGSVLLYVLFLYLLKQQVLMREAAASNDLMPWLLAVIESYIGAWLTSLCLIAGKQALNRSNALLRYLADSSYWVYLVHLPILFTIQYWLLDSELGLIIKFGISILTTMVLCLLSYQLLVRRTVIGTLLGGRRFSSVAGINHPHRGEHKNRANGERDAPITETAVDCISAKSSRN